MAIKITKQVKALIAPLNNAIEEVSKQLDELYDFACRSPKGSDDALVSVLDIITILMNNKDFALFMNRRENKVVILEPLLQMFNINYIDVPQIARVYLKDVYLDMSNQRPTDFLRCLVNLLSAGGYNCELAKTIGAKRRPDGKIVIPDGGHRVIMAILAGRDYIEMYISPHDLNISVEDMIKNEGNVFVVSNETQEPVPEIWLHRSLVSQKDKQALLIDELLTKSLVDVAKGLSIEDAKKGITMNKVRFLYDYIGIKSAKKKRSTTYEYAFDEEDWCNAVEVFRYAYPNAEEININCVLSLSRLFWQIRYNKWDWGIELNGDILKTAFLKWVKDTGYAAATLTKIKKLGNKNRQSASDYATMTNLFNVSTKVKRRIIKEWNLEDTIDVV